jgi:predicted RNase H-like HicB family nuclease
MSGVILLYKDQVTMKYTIETEQEVDGRWIAEVNEIPGVMKYGKSCEEAIALAEALAYLVLKGNRRYTSTIMK